MAKYTNDQFRALLKEGKVKYTAEVPNSPDIPGEGKPRRTIFSDELIGGVHSGVKTLYENFQAGVKVAENKNCLGYRPMKDGVAQSYVFETYSQINQRINKVANALAHKGFAKGDKVGIFAINCVEWVVAAEACNASSLISVPLYDTLGTEAIQHIVGQTEMRIVFAQTDKIKILLTLLEKLPTIQTIVVIGKVEDDFLAKAKELNVTMFGFQEFENEGEKPAELTRPIAEDVCTIMYTSGTTGLPKGVILTHECILADCGGVEFLGRCGAGAPLIKEDVHLSYLPLAHVMERVIMGYLLGIGGTIGFYQGSPLKLLEDIDALKPTIFPSVPRLLNRIYSKINDTVELNGGISATLFNMALNAKKSGLASGTTYHWIWDRLVFSKTKARLGGRVRFIITGSAPISPEVMSFLRIAFCCEVYEGYGQTESSAGATMTTTGDYEPGTVGTPMPCNEIKLVDVPEMNYTSQDKPFPRGEICFRGKNVFKGYYKAEDKTKEALDENGWLHSGDIGLWDEKGRLKIIDRKKNIFKLAQGEYIAPEKIENVYAKCKWVAQSFVYGDSLKAFLVAVVIPNEENLLPWCKANGIQGDLETVIKDPKVKKMILDDMLKVGKQLDLKSFEQVKDIILDSRTFTVENDILTPTFKLKRPQAKEFFLKEITALIEKIDQEESEKEKKKNAEEEAKK